MIVTKITYFFWGGLIGTFYVYLYPFFVSIGIPESKAGIITGLSFAVMSVTGPIWGILTDYTGRQKVVVTVMGLCSATWIASVPFIGEGKEFTFEMNMALNIKREKFFIFDSPSTHDIHFGSLLKS